jgi:hypothetical protein
MSLSFHFTATILEEGFVNLKRTNNGSSEFPQQQFEGQKCRFLESGKNCSCRLQAVTEEWT